MWRQRRRFTLSERRRFLRFVVTGGIAAAVNIGSRELFSTVMRFELAIVAAYLVGMITAFVLARAFVFEPTGRTARGEFAWFTAVNMVSLAQVWIVSVGLDRIVFPAMGIVWHRETMAHVVGVLSPVVTSYVLHKKLSFRSAQA